MLRLRLWRISVLFSDVIGRLILKHYGTSVKNYNKILMSLRKHINPCLRISQKLMKNSYPLTKEVTRLKQEDREI